MNGYDEKMKKLMLENDGGKQSDYVARWIRRENEKVAKHLIEKRKSKEREDMIRRNAPVTLDNLFNQIEEGKLKDLNIISEYLYKKLSIFLSQRIGKNDPKPIQPETSFQFKKIVYKLEADEIISVNKACELLGVTVDEYNNEDNNY